MASFTGTWQVVSSPDFDEGYLRMEVDPYVMLKQSGERVEGKYQVGLQTGTLDGWLESENLMLFSFEGMDELEEMLDPDKYFRISRSFYVSIASIDQIHDYFGNRLLLNLKPSVDKESIVSREKVADFKKWMGK